MQAPTDNLYKFIAISALICFLYFNFDLNKRSEELQSKAEQHAMEVAELQFRVDTYMKKQNKLSESLKLINPQDALSGEEKKTIEEWHAHSAKLDDIQLANIKLNKSVEFLNKTAESLDKLSDRYYINSIASIFFFWVGMYLWYHKTQKYIDQKEAAINVERKPRVKNRITDAT